MGEYTDFTNDELMDNYFYEIDNKSDTDDYPEDKYDKYYH